MKLLLLSWLLALGLSAGEVKVTLLETPGGGLQPQAIVGPDGTLHLLYFGGKPQAGNLFYARRPAGAQEFLPAIQVNRSPNAAVATGTIRGGQLALGKDGAIHVAWMGSKKTRTAPGDHRSSPMLYTRSTDGGASFEPERNIIFQAYGLDGGGSVAADEAGNVHVIWHAPKRPGAEGEANRTVWIATSTDNGATFAPERPAWDEATGVCGCCGLEAFATPDSQIFLLYRAASRLNQRDMYLLRANGGRTPLRLDGSPVSSWRIARCPMSSASFAPGPNRVGAAWESQDSAWFSVMSTDAPGRQIGPFEIPGGGQIPIKHPSIALDGEGNILVAWTLGRGWGKPGPVHWRVFRPNGDPTDQAGERDGLPAWSKPAAVYHLEDGFLVFY